MSKHSTTTLIQEEEDASIDVYEEHQELLRQYEELRDCLFCHQDVKKIVRKYLLFKDTSSMNVPEYEDEILKFRTSFDNIMDKLQALTLEQSDYVQDDVSKHQNDVMSCLQQFREQCKSQTSCGSLL